MNNLQQLSHEAEAYVTAHQEPLELCEGVDLIMNGFGSDLHSWEQSIICSSDSRFEINSEEY